MADRPQDLARQTQAQLDASGLAVPPLNSNPAPLDPARGYAGPGAPLPGGANAQPGTPDPAKAFANSAPAPGQGAAGAAPPDPSAVFAAGPQYATETTRTTTTSGMSDKDIAEQRGVNATAAEAQRTASASEGEAKRLAVEAEEQEQTRLLNEAAEEQKKLAAKQAVTDFQEAEVKNKLQAASDWRPDRTELFNGSTGAARGILAAVAVMAGGWMQGRGLAGNNPFSASIERMIDENVKDQVRTNSATIQFLREQKGDVAAAAAELKKRQLEYATQKVNARAALSKIPAAQAGVKAYNDAAAARTAEWQAEQEKALRKSVSSTISRHTTPVQPAERKAPTEAERQGASQINELADIITDVEGLDEGDLTDVVGYGAMKPLGFLPSDNDMRRTLGLAKPGQTRAINAIDRYQRFVYSTFKNEPNGDLAGIFSRIGVPQNDAEIPEWKRNLRREFNNLNKARGGDVKAPAARPGGVF